MRVIAPFPADFRQDPAGMRTPSRIEWAGLALVLAATILVYKDAFAGFFVQDDFPWLNWTRFKNLSDYAASFFRFHPADVYRPLSQETFFCLGQKFFGLRPAAFHVVNLASHLAGTAFLFILLRRFFGILPCCIGALFYGIHNAHLRGVYWIAAASEPMALACFLLSVILFLRAVDGEQPRRVLPATAAMLIGVLCKESILVLPLVLAAYCLLFVPRKILWTTPFFAISGIYFVAKLRSTVSLAPYPLTLGVETWNNLKVYLAWTSGFSETLLKQALKTDPASWYGVVAAVVFLAVLATLVFSQRRRLILFALAWYAVALQPFLYFKGQSYPYYMAPALAGFSIIVASWVPAARTRPNLKGLTAVLLAVILLFLISYSSVRLEGAWWNQRTWIARDILRALVKIDAAVPSDGSVFIYGLGMNEFGPLHYGDALLAYGLKPKRFVLIGVDNSVLPGPSGSLDSTYCYSYRNGQFVDLTAEFRNDPMAFLVVTPKVYQVVPGVALRVSPGELTAGRDTLSIQVMNLNVRVVDVLYSLDGVIKPPVYRWQLDRSFTARVLADKSTATGKYQFLAVRDSSKPVPDGWIRVDASALVVPEAKDLSSPAPPSR